MRFTAWEIGAPLFVAPLAAAYVAYTEDQPGVILQTQEDWCDTLLLLAHGLDAIIWIQNKTVSLHNGTWLH